MQDVLGLVLGGGRGARLYPLTKTRSEPAVPLAGKYRLIDVPLSNCINSGIHRVYVLTQFLSVSLHRHIAYTYKLSPFNRGFIEVLAAQQTNEAADWYAGTADALRQNLRYIEEDPCRDVLVLSGDQLYTMDFGHLVEAHRARGSDVTVAVLPVPRAQAVSLGVVRLDDDHRVTHLAEKPQTDEQLAPLRTPPGWLERHGLTAGGREYLGNMGIYVFRREALFDLLAAQPAAVDLVREIFPRHLASHRIRGYLFDGYWQDLGAIKTYYEAHLALASDTPPFDFHGVDGIIYTRMRHLPASRLTGARVEQCLISDGCTVQPGARLERCVIGLRSQIGRDVRMRETVMIGADRSETDADRADNRRRGIPDLGVGDGAVVERAILDKDCRVGRNVRLVNQQGVLHGEGANYVIRDGIVVIPNGTVVPDGTVI
jgi:glucose-1-phosphate adenylyltransferase